MAEVTDVKEKPKNFQDRLAALEERVAQQEQAIFSHGVFFWCFIATVLVIALFA